MAVFTHSNHLGTLSCIKQIPTEFEVEAAITRYDVLAAKALRDLA